jgi:hypothetical protein
MRVIETSNFGVFGLDLLASKYEYFESMKSFHSEEVIDLSHRGVSMYIVLRLLLNDYDIDEVFFENIDNILNIYDEFVINNSEIIQIVKDYCNKIIIGLCEMNKINSAIWRFYNNKLTKKQKKSEQYSSNNWKSVKYLNHKNTLEKNKEVYNLCSLTCDRYEGKLNFDIIADMYVAKSLLVHSKLLYFENMFSKRVTRCATVNINDLCEFMFYDMKYEYELIFENFTFNQARCSTETMKNIECLQNLPNLYCLHLISCSIEAYEEIINIINFISSNISKLIINNLTITQGSGFYGTPDSDISKSYPNISIESKEILLDETYRVLSSYTSWDD